MYVYWAPSRDSLAGTIECVCVSVCRQKHDEMKVLLVVCVAILITISIPTKCVIQYNISSSEPPGSGVFTSFGTLH